MRPAIRRGASDSWAQSSTEAKSGDPAAAETNTKSNDGNGCVREYVNEDGVQDIISDSPQESRLEDADPIAAAKERPVVNEEGDMLLARKQAIKPEIPQPSVVKR